jgi:hypothetical protein
MGEAVGFTRLPNFMIDDYWSEIEPLIKKPFDKMNVDYYTLEDIRGFIKDESMQAWIAIDEKIKGCVITDVINYPRKRILELLFIGGEDLDSWLYGWENIKDFAKKEGCKEIKSEGRPGWIKKADPKMTTTVYYWDLT